MEIPEDGRHTFIVRIWREPRELAGMAPEWRGLAERIGTGEHRYFRRLDELVGFVQSYMTMDNGDRDA